MYQHFGKSTGKIAVLDRSTQKSVRWGKKGKKDLPPTCTDRVVTDLEFTIKGGQDGKERRVVNTEPETGAERDFGFLQTKKKKKGG